MRECVSVHAYVWVSVCVCVFVCVRVWIRLISSRQIVLFVSGILDRDRHIAESAYLLAVIVWSWFLKPSTSAHVLRACSWDRLLHNRSSELKYPWIKPSPRPSNFSTFPETLTVNWQTQTTWMPQPFPHPHTFPGITDGQKLAWQTAKI